MRLFRSALALAGLTCISPVLADVEFTKPTPGTIMRAADVVTVYWKDSGLPPRISDLTKYDLYLCAGGDTPGSYADIATLVRDVSFSRGNSVSFRIDPGFGGNEPNAYFLKMISFSSSYTPISTTYSPRFTLTDMTGSFTPNLTTGLQALNDNEPSTGNGNANGSEDNVNALLKRQAVGKYTIPYALQTGATKYAPMPKKPGSTIPPPEQTPTPLNPASPYHVATAYLPIPTVSTTMSASETWSVVSIENTASPAPHPHDAKMKRFLERWKDE